MPVVPPLRVQLADAVSCAQVKKRQEQHDRRRKVFDKTRSKDEAASTQRLREERKRRYMQEGKADARAKRARGAGGKAGEGRDKDD